MTPADRARCSAQARFEVAAVEVFRNLRDRACYGTHGFSGRWRDMHWRLADAAYREARESRRELRRLL